MRETWESLTDEQKASIKSRARTLSEDEVGERFAEQDGRVVFRIIRKTDRALAGGLDIDGSEEEQGVDKPVAGKADAGAAAIPLGQASAGGIEEDEIAEVTLISPEDFDYEPEITDADAEAAKPIDAAVSQLAGYYVEDTISMGEADSGEGDTAGLPSAVDHRPDQSPIKDQASRGTCVAHASMALLEAYDHITDDLSEQCTHYKFNEFLGRPHNANAGLRTTDAAPFLARSDGRVCEENDWPYIPSQSAINQMVSNGTYGPPQACNNNATYGYKAYKIITDKGLVGESIKNTRYLESLLHKGHNIVIGTWVSWDDKDNNGILDPVLDQNGTPIGRGGHAMLVVGYNRPSQYFIVKNSWSRGWGHDGYAYFHYNLVRSCFKYGFVVDSVVPEAPTRLPRRLAQAPYSARRISRASLRAAILLMKTSRGRYAVCEAYAGYNLLLRNLRVYNADGSLHLERDSLVIRGTYLCDIDSARETSMDADFWWEAVRPGVNYLVPRNGASAYIAFDLAHLSAQQISATSLSSAPIASRDLDYAVVVGTTTANRRFKMLVHMKPGNRLQISYLELFRSDGRRYRHATNIHVPSSWTYNLDTLRTSGGQYADIWWHVISNGVGFLERYSRARTQLVWRF
ncbi:C1 family peptidase [Candidatus Poribacteria bacterium]